MRSYLWEKSKSLVSSVGSLIGLGRTAAAADSDQKATQSTTPNANALFTRGNGIIETTSSRKALSKDEKAALIMEGYQYLAQAADLGHAEAQWRCGVLCLNLGILKDIDKARAWLEKACDHQLKGEELAKAKLMLAVMEYQGIGFEKNERAALIQLHRAINYSKSLDLNDIEFVISSFPIVNYEKISEERAEVRSLIKKMWRVVNSREFLDLVSGSSVSRTAGETDAKQVQPEKNSNTDHQEQLQRAEQEAQARKAALAADAKKIANEKEKDQLKEDLQEIAAKILAAKQAEEQRAKQLAVEKENAAQLKREAAAEEAKRIADEKAKKAAEKKDKKSKRKKKKSALKNSDKTQTDVAESSAMTVAPNLTRSPEVPKTVLPDDSSRQAEVASVNTDAVVSQTSAGKKAQPKKEAALATLPERAVHTAQQADVKASPSIAAGKSQQAKGSEKGFSEQLAVTSNYPEAISASPKSTRSIAAKVRTAQKKASSVVSGSVVRVTTGSQQWGPNSLQTLFAPSRPSPVTTDNVPNLVLPQIVSLSEDNSVPAAVDTSHAISKDKLAEIVLVSNAPTQVVANVKEKDPVTAQSLAADSKAVSLSLSSLPLKITPTALQKINASAAMVADMAATDQKKRAENAAADQKEDECSGLYLKGSGAACLWFQLNEQKATFSPNDVDLVLQHTDLFNGESIQRQLQEKSFAGSAPMREPRGALGLYRNIAFGLEGVECDYTITSKRYHSPDPIPFTSSWFQVHADGHLTVKDAEQAERLTRMFATRKFEVDPPDLTKPVNVENYAKGFLKQVLKWHYKLGIGKAGAHFQTDPDSSGLIFNRSWLIKFFSKLYHESPKSHARDVTKGSWCREEIVGLMKEEFFGLSEARIMLSAFIEVVIRDLESQIKIQLPASFRNTFIEQGVLQLQQKFNAEIIGQSQPLSNDQYNQWLKDTLFAVVVSPLLAKMGSPQDRNYHTTVALLNQFFPLPPYEIIQIGVVQTRLVSIPKISAPIAMAHNQASSKPLSALSPSFVPAGNADQKQNMGQILAGVKSAALSPSLPTVSAVHHVVHGQGMMPLPQARRSSRVSASAASQALDSESDFSHRG